MPVSQVHGQERKVKAPKKTKWQIQEEQLQRVRAIWSRRGRAAQFRETVEMYRAAPSSERAALLRTLIKLNEKKALPILEGALLQRENMTLRGDALKALELATPGSLKAVALKSMLSPYVYERKALAETLIAWGLEEGETGLRELALDKSVSVRRAALQGLGKIGGALDLLRSYALDGPDEGTATVSASAWISSEHARQGTQAQRISVELALLGSIYREAQDVGVQHLVREGLEACGPLSEATLAQRGATEALDAANKALWPQCIDHLVNRARSAKASVKATLLSAFARWRKTDPKVSRFIEQHLTHPYSEVRVAVSKATDALDEGELRIQRLDQLRLDRDVQVRCASLEGLIQRPDPTSLTPPDPLPEPIRESLYVQLQDALRAHIPTPRRDTTWLTCSLSAIERLGVADFDLLLAKAYKAWRRSIAYGLLRRQVVSAAARSPGPARLEVLMEGMLDPDPEVKRRSEQALRITSR